MQTFLPQIFVYLGDAVETDSWRWTANQLCRATDEIRNAPLGKLSTEQRKDLLDALIVAEASLVGYVPEHALEMFTEGMRAVWGLVDASGWTREEHALRGEEFNTLRAWTKIFRNKLQNLAIELDLAERKRIKIWRNAQ